MAYGAEVSHLVVTEETTHIVSWLKRGDAELVELATEDAGPSVEVVSPQWLWDSINTTARRPEQPYLVPLL